MDARHLEHRLSAQIPSEVAGAAVSQGVCLLASHLLSRLSLGLFVFFVCVCVGLSLCCVLL